MAKVTKKQWLDALSKSRRLYAQTASMAEASRWRDARELFFGTDCVLCQAAVRATRQRGSACRACVWKLAGHGHCFPSLRPFWNALDKSRIKPLRIATAELEAAYKGVRRWVREHC